MEQELAMIWSGNDVDSAVIRGYSGARRKNREPDGRAWDSLRLMLLSALLAFSSILIGRSSPVILNRMAIVFALIAVVSCLVTILRRAYWRTIILRTANCAPKRPFTPPRVAPGLADTNDMAVPLVVFKTRSRLQCWGVPLAFALCSLGLFVFGQLGLVIAVVTNIIIQLAAAAWPVYYRVSNGCLEVITGVPWRSTVRVIRAVPLGNADVQYCCSERFVVIGVRGSLSGPLVIDRHLIYAPKELDDAIVCASQVSGKSTTPFDQLVG